MMKDIAERIAVENTIDPQTVTADVTGNQVDVTGFRSIAIVAVVGSVTDGTHTLTVQESDDGSNWSDIPADELDGSFDDITSSNTGNQKVNLKTSKKYIRINVTASGTTSGGDYGVVVVKGNAHEEPVV